MRLMLLFTFLPAFFAVPVSDWFEIKGLAKKDISPNIIQPNFKLPDNPFDNASEAENITLQEVDAEADNLAPLNKVYTYKEAIELRENLHKQINNNPKDMGLYWALLRFYANAPNFVGGNSNMGLQVAGYIYGMNKYIGCLAYEYVYSRHYQFDLAAEWYKRSTLIPLARNMHWQEITYAKTVLTQVKVSGNFNNWKSQLMYQKDNGEYSRKIMIPTCENCNYKLILDDRKLTDPTKTEMAFSRY
ncbi:MAG: hypothetical protein KGO81_01760 [Bacteroidota bacterium]|nr:hypothetical protein [Bacteroidota bacterium]